MLHLHLVIAELERCRGPLGTSPPLLEGDRTRVAVAVLGEAVVIGLDSCDWRGDFMRETEGKWLAGLAGGRPRHAGWPSVPQIHQDANARRLRPFRGKLGRHAMESVA